jgi:hypothetical protein
MPTISSTITSYVGYGPGLKYTSPVVVTNTGLIDVASSRYDSAVYGRGGGSVINHGSIIGSGDFIAGIGVRGSGGTIVNTGLIQGYFSGVNIAGVGVVINSGTIRSNYLNFLGGSSNFGMYGGSLTNTQSGYINNGVNLNVFSDGVGYNATVVNAGTIDGDDTIGVQLNAELAPSGAEYEGTGTIIDSGVISTTNNDHIAIYFGGTNALLVLQPGYKIDGLVLTGGNYPHTLELQGSEAAPVTVRFTPVEFENFGTVGFAAGGSNAGTLVLAGTADLPGTIIGFTGLHDVIDLQYISDGGKDATTHFDPATDQLTVDGDNGSTVLQLDPAEDYSGLTFIPMQDAAGTGTDVLICYCKGTHILTDHGEVPVEHLREGDHVRLFDGRTAPVIWIGQGQVLATRGQRSVATPVIVRKGALADNVPNRDLHITKAHSLYIDGVLIPVEFLVNHRSILWDDRAQEVSIYHVELEDHDVLIANGAPAESYRDDGNRWLFRNANSGWDAPPKPACAPVLTGGPVVDAIWRRLLDRAGSRRGVPLTSDPDLHLLVDGQRLDGMKRPHGGWLFRLADVPRCVRLCSRAGVPQELGFARDPRSLGVALRWITLRQGTRSRMISADDERLEQGFHSFEADNKFRWTDGDALIPHALFADLYGSLEIELNVTGTMRYPDDGERVAVA